MAENNVGEGEEKKSSKKLIIIIALILLIAAGGAGYYFLAEAPAKGEEKASEQVEEVEPEEGANEALYYDLNQPLTVNFPKGSSASIIQVSVSILVNGEEAIDALKKHEPMIRNNLLMAISAQSADVLKTREGKKALRKNMLNEVEKVMQKMTHKNKVKNVYFTAFVMQ